jgi:uncharacterized protein YecE (DUF72 family)
MRIRTGTSGYSYKEWKGSFYPADLPAAKMLAYYAGRLDTVEINNTFYRMPKREVVRTWGEQVPAGFSFVLKATQRITHKKKLKDVDDEVAYITETARELGDKLGPMLFQFPPWFKKDVTLLRDFLAILPEGWRAAFEFRSSSWSDDEVYDALRAGNVALVASDGDGKDEPVLVATADYGYLRLRRTEYDDAALARWAERVQAQPWRDAHVFFKHEEDCGGPELARAFTRLLGT